MLMFPRFTQLEENLESWGSGLMRLVFLQGHLNWPPFCLVIMNVTHLAHHVSIDRFNRKVSTKEVACRAKQQLGRDSRGRRGALRLIHN